MINSNALSKSFTDMIVCILEMETLSARPRQPMTILRFKTRGLILATLYVHLKKFPLSPARLKSQCSPEGLICEVFDVRPSVFGLSMSELRLEEIEMSIGPVICQTNEIAFS